MPHRYGNSHAIWDHTYIVTYHLAVVTFSEENKQSNWRSQFWLENCYLTSVCVCMYVCIYVCMYTVGHKKTCPFYFFDNSGKYWRIIVIFSLLYSLRNCGIRAC